MECFQSIDSILSCVFRASIPRMISIPSNLGFGDKFPSFPGIPSFSQQSNPVAGTSVAGTNVAGTSVAGTSVAGTSVAGTSSQINTPSPIPVSITPETKQEHLLQVQYNPLPVSLIPDTKQEQRRILQVHHMAGD